MKITILVLKFLFVAALFIVSNNNLHLSVPQERDTFVMMYNAWFGSIFDQFKEVTGYVVNSEWLPKQDSHFGFNLSR